MSTLSTCFSTNSIHHGAIPCFPKLLKLLVLATAFMWSRITTYNEHISCIGHKREMPIQRNMVLLDGWLSNLCARFIAFYLLAWPMLGRWVSVEICNAIITLFNSEPWSELKMNSQRSTRSLSLVFEQCMGMSMCTLEWFSRTQLIQHHNAWIDTPSVP